MTNLNNRMRRYSIRFKRQVIREIEETGMTLDWIRKKYDIRGGDTIQRWMRKFGKNHLINQVIRIETMEEKDRIKQMEAEIKKLKLALADSLLAQRSLEVLIEEANKEYKTDLKKSFGETVLKDSPKSSK